MSEPETKPETKPTAAQEEEQFYQEELARGMMLSEYAVSEGLTIDAKDKQEPKDG